MTEDQWLACTDPMPMLVFLKGKVSERKLRLFACACCRRHRNVLRGKRNLRVLEQSEAFADGQIGRKEMQRAREKWYAFDYPFPRYGTWQSALAYATMLDAGAWKVAKETAPQVVHTSPRPEAETSSQASLLRDVFGNPFRPATFSTAWRTSTAVALACQMYDSRDFSPRPILADALQDAGCASDDILNHCWGPGPHVPGCWVVDLVLGKV